jgi:hypothetical protein
MTILFSCSVDDGHPSDLRLAQLLAAYELKATFYLPIANIEGPPVLHGPQIRELGQAFEIGSHTHDHCFLSLLGERQARFQIERGKSVLENLLGRQVAGFCYPGGRYGGVHVRQVEAAGFRYARTTRNLYLEPGPGRFEMATTCQFYPHGRAVYLRNFVRGGQWLKRRASLRRALRHDGWGARLHAMLDGALQDGGVFHLWLHTLDIDRLGAWSELDAFLRRVAACVPPSRRLTNGQLADRFFPPA